MKKNRAFKKAEVIVGLLVATCFVGAVGCRDKSVHQSSQPSDPPKPKQEATVVGPEGVAVNSQGKRVPDQPRKPEQWDLHSPDGEYGATRISHQGGVHFKVGEIEGGRVVFITHGQYSTANDVKAGRFSSDSMKFAASYHYGHAGNYTWVGIWNLKTEKLIRSKRLSEWQTTIPNSVFEEDDGS
ncbi:hypothetical protein ES703_119799 [subsurface metagenome]